jgi:hypothetical protein
MTENCLTAVGQDGSHPAAAMTQANVAYRIYAAMKTMQPAGMYTPPNCGFGQTRRTQLADRDYAVLPSGDSGERACVAFPSHTDGNATQEADSPPRG